MANYFTDPALCAELERSPEEDLQAALGRWLPMFTGKDHTWEHLAFIREHWDGPILLKGIQHVEDARQAADAGIEGIVVSNHGGRQVDGAIASLDALPPIADAVGDRLEVLFDSGVRTGADVIKAVGLGAKAVLVGRPILWGLSVGGEGGAINVLEILRRELDEAMLLCGCAKLDDIDRSLLSPFLAQD